MDCRSRVLTTHRSGDRRRYRRVLGAKTLTSDRVRNFAGDDLGKVKEIMVDLQSGRVAYVVLAYGGFMRFCKKLFAVPWDELMIDEGNKELVLNASVEQLENAPGFARDNWPDTADPDWRAQIHDHHGGGMARIGAGPSSASVLGPALIWSGSDPQSADMRDGRLGQRGRQPRTTNAGEAG